MRGVIFSVSEENCVLSPFDVVAVDRVTEIQSPRDPTWFCHAIETYQLITAADASESVELTLKMDLKLGERLMLFDKHDEPRLAGVAFDSHLVLQAIERSM